MSYPQKHKNAFYENLFCLSRVWVGNKKESTICALTSFQVNLMLQQIKFDYEKKTSL